MRQSVRDKNDRRRKTAISLGIMLMGTLLLGFGIKRQIEPNIDSVSQLKARGIVTEIISETINEEFSHLDGDDELFIVTKGETGGIQMVQANTALINQRISAITVRLQKRYEEIQPEKVNIPLGTVLGSPLLSQSKKGISISVLPLSVSKCDFQTEFESQGINQTKYKIFVIIESNVRVLQPFSQESFTVTTKMLISEIVIVGDVPQNYVYVPEEDILDVT